MHSLRLPLVVRLVLVVVAEENGAASPTGPPAADEPGIHLFELLELDGRSCDLRSKPIQLLRRMVLDIGEKLYVALHHRYTRCKLMGKVGLTSFHSLPIYCSDQTLD